MKRILCIVLFALIIVVSIGPIAGFNANAAVREEVTLSIYSYSDGGGGSSDISGHSFIVVNNRTFSSIAVGQMVLSPGESVSLGTFGNKNPHNGLWYNLESYFSKTYSAYQGRVSLTKVIYSPILGMVNSSLDIINSVIRSSDDWSYLNNCSSFASRVWNSVSTSENQVDAGIINTPNNLKESIMNQAYTVNRDIPYNARLGYFANGVFVPVNIDQLSVTIAMTQNEDIMTFCSFPNEYFVVESKNNVCEVGK